MTSENNIEKISQYGLSYEFESQNILCDPEWNFWSKKMITWWENYRLTGTKIHILFLFHLIVPIWIYTNIKTLSGNTIKNAYTIYGQVSNFKFSAMKGSPSATNFNQSILIEPIYRELELPFPLRNWKEFFNALIFPYLNLPALWVLFD